MTSLERYMEATREWITVTDIAEELDVSLPAASQFIKGHPGFFEKKRAKDNRHVLVRFKFVSRRRRDGNVGRRKR